MAKLLIAVVSTKSSEVSIEVAELNAVKLVNPVATSAAPSPPPRNGSMLAGAVVSKNCCASMDVLVKVPLLLEPDEDEVSTIPENISAAA